MVIVKWEGPTKQSIQNYSTAPDVHLWTSIEPGSRKWAVSLSDYVVVNIYSVFSNRQAIYHVDA